MKTLTETQYTRHKIPKNSHPSLWDKEVFTQLWFQNSQQQMCSLLGIGHSSLIRAVKRLNLVGLKSRLVSSREGEQRKDPQGYIQIHINGKWVLEHRFIMGRFLGRQLKNSEAIHHIDGDKTNNRIENLQILSPSDHKIKEYICANCPLKKEIQILKQQFPNHST